MTARAWRWLVLGYCAAFWIIGGVSLAHAASPPPPGPVATVCDSCSTTLAVTSTTGRVALPLSVTDNPSMIALTILNTGTKDAFFKLGDVTAVAVTTNTRAPAGRSIVVYVNGATYLAAITAGSDTTSLQIWQGNGSPQLGALIGGGGGGTVTSITASTGLSGGTITTTGTIALLPAAVGVIGGVNSSAAVTHNFLTAISTAGVVSHAQPACADLSDAGTGCSGAASAVGANPTATIGASTVNGVATTFMRSDAAPPLPATLPALSGVNLTNLNAGALASGLVPLVRGGNNADLSATGGASFVLRQSSSGAAVTVSRLACADLSDASTGCSGAASAVGANPSASITGPVTNGVATTFMRSDAVPALGTITQQIVVNLNAASPPTPVTGTAIQFNGANAVNSFIENNSFGATPGLLQRRADGTNASPTAVQSGEVLANLGARPYDGSAYASASTGSLQAIASENFSGTNHGTDLIGNCTAITTIVTAECFRAKSSGFTIPTGSTYQINGTQIAAGNLSNGTTGSGAVVLAAGATLSTPTLGVAGATSLALGGATIGADALGVTGTVTVSGASSIGNVNVTSSTIPANGIYLSGANTVSIATNSGQKWSVSSGGTISSVTTTALQLTAGTPTATAPNVIPNRGDTTTGLGGASGHFAAIAGGVNQIDCVSTGCTAANAMTLSAALTYGGVTLTNSVQGTGSMVLSASPTFTGTAVFGALRSPIIGGGSAASSTLTLESTTGIGTSDSLVLKTGSQVAALAIDTNQRTTLTSADSATTIGTATAGLILKNTNATATNLEYIQFFTNNATSASWFASQSGGFLWGTGNGGATEMTLSSAGLFALPSIGSDATHTDSSVCQDTTSHAFYSGSGAAGICLGTSFRDSKSGIVPIAAELLASDRILILQWRYKPKYGDPSRLHYGPIADDVCKQYPDLCSRDPKGKVISYDWPSLQWLMLEKDRKEIAALRAVNDNLAQRIAKLERH